MSQTMDKEKYIKEASEKFEALLREQIKRAEDMKNAAGAKDFAAIAADYSRPLRRRRNRPDYHGRGRKTTYKAPRRRTCIRQGCAEKNRGTYA